MKESDDWLTRAFDRLEFAVAERERRAREASCDHAAAVSFAGGVICTACGKSWNGGIAKRRAAPATPDYVSWVEGRADRLDRACRAAVAVTWALALFAGALVGYTFAPLAFPAAETTLDSPVSALMALDRAQDSSATARPMVLDSTLRAWSDTLNAHPTNP